MDSNQQPTYSDSDIQNAGKPPRPPAPTPPPEVHDYLHPIVDKPKHSYNPKRVMLLIGLTVGISLLSVAIMVVNALLPVQDSGRPTTQDTPGQSQTAPDTLSAEQTIDHLKVYFKGTEAATRPITRPVQAPGKSFFTVIPDTAPLISLAGIIESGRSEAQLESIIKSLDYDKYAKQVLKSGENGSDYLADFTRSDTVCQVEVLKNQAKPAEPHRFEIRCLNMETYSEYANIQQPLVSRYTPLTATSVQYGFIGKPTTKPSKLAGYTLAELPVGSVIDSQLTTTRTYAAFYQSADKIWRYFTNHDDGVLIECEQFTTELRAIYDGESCRNAKTGAVETVVPKKR